MRKNFIILLLFFMTLWMTGCTSPSDQSYSPQIVSMSGNLSDSLRMIFKTFNYPTSVVPVLVSSESIPDPIKTGAFADNLFDEFSENMAADNFEDFGLLVVITQEPKLMQVRLGNYYKKYAELCGVSLGKQYLEIQQLYSYSDRDFALHEMLTNVCNNLTERKNLSWYQKNQLNSINGAVSSVMSWFGSPSENFYGTYIAKPIYTVISFGSNIFSSWLGGIVLLFTLVLFIKNLMNRLLSGISIPILRSILIGLINFLLGLGVSVSVMGCASVLSSGRLEDLIALKSFGIPYVDKFIFSPEMFVQECNYILAGCFLLSMLLALYVANDNFLKSIYPFPFQQNAWNSLNEVSKSLILAANENVKVKEGDPSPYTTIFTEGTIPGISKNIIGLGMGALFFFPKAVLLTGIAYSITKIIFKWKEYAIVWNVRKKNNFMPMNSIVEILGGIIVYIIIAIVFTFIIWYINPFDRSDKLEGVAVETPIVLKNVYVTAKTANLRTGPGTEYSRATILKNGKESIWQVTRGDKLDVLEEIDGWYKVKASYSSQEVYIKKTLCRDTQQIKGSDASATNAKEDANKSFTYKKVKGTVVDTKGDAVIGATVLVKGTNQGTVTDINGNFSISDISSDAQFLIVSYIGLKTQETPINENLQIVMHKDN